MSFIEAYPYLKALYGSVFDEYVGNFGPDAFVLDQTKKQILDKPITISIAASAGDIGTIKESLGKFEQQSRQFGRILGEELKNQSIDAVVSTGGCPNIGSWVTQEISRYNPKTSLVALSPTH